MNIWQQIYRLGLAAGFVLIIMLAGCGTTTTNTGPDGGTGNSTVPTIATGIILQMSPTSDSYTGNTDANRSDTSTAITTTTTPTP